MYTPQNPLPGKPGFYESFRMDSPEEARRSLLDAWSTPEQQIFNLMHEQCPKCKGRGYLVYRQKGQLVRERAGCERCLGLAVVPRSSSALSSSASTRTP